MQTMYSQGDNIALGSSPRFLEGLGFMRCCEGTEFMCKASRKVLFNSSISSSEGTGHNQCSDSVLMTK